MSVLGVILTIEIIGVRIKINDPSNIILLINFGTKLYKRCKFFITNEDELKIEYYINFQNNEGDK